MGNRLISSVMLCLALAGCGGSLTVRGMPDPTDPNSVPDSDSMGIPVPYTESFVEIGVLTATSTAKKTCEEVPYSKLVQIVTNKYYFLDFKSAPFGSTDFSVEFNQDGTLKKIAMNSDSQTDENLTAAAELTKAIAGLLPTSPLRGGGADIQSAGREGASAQADDLIVCDIGPKPTQFIPLSDYLGANH